MINKIEIDPSQTDQLASKYKDVIFLLPASLKEYKWAIVTSFAAGICEEIVFRGFMFLQLNQYLPLVPALILTNLVFALPHYATGIKNALTTFMLGLFWSLSYLLTDTLAFAIFTHILIDMHSSTQAVKLNTLLEQQVES